MNSLQKSKVVALLFTRHSMPDVNDLSGITATDVPEQADEAPIDAVLTILNNVKKISRPLTMRAKTKTHAGRKWFFTILNLMTMRFLL